MCITYHGDQVRVGGGGESAAGIQRPLHLPRQPGPHHRRGEGELISLSSLMIIIIVIISLVITIVITAGCGRGPGRCPGSQHPLPRPQQQGGVRGPGRHQARGQARQGPGYMRQIFSSALQIFSLSSLTTTSRPRRTACRRPRRRWCRTHSGPRTTSSTATDTRSGTS